MSTITAPATSSPTRWASFDVDTLAEWAGMSHRNIDPESALGLLLRATRDELVDMVIDYPETLTEPTALLSKLKWITFHALDTAGFKLHDVEFKDVGQAPHWVVFRLVKCLVDGMAAGSLVVPK